MDLKIQCIILMQMMDLACRLKIKIDTSSIMELLVEMVDGKQDKPAIASK